MLRGWLLRGCAAPSSRVSIVSAPRLLSTCQGRSLLRQAQQQLPVRRPEVTCLAGLDIGRRYSKPANYEKATSFEQLKLDSRLVEALNAANLGCPTDIQSLAVPAIINGGDYLLAAQTGSGKTLAYMLPLIHQLKAREGEPGMERRGKRPKVLVLAPTKELVEQITAVAKTLCHYAKFRVVPCSANYNENTQSRALTAPLEVLVATPTRLMKVLEHGRVALGDVRWLVVDEADTMLETSQGFAAEVRHLVEILRSKEPQAQTILVTATMSTAVKKLVTAFLPDLQRIEAEGFHKPVPTARHEFRPLAPGQDKMQLLLETLQSDVVKGRKVLVFCNSMDSCRAVEHTVRERDMPTVCYHGEMPIAARKEAMAQFAGNHAAGDEPGAAATVMVATDLAARGLDFPGSIDHVINFDMPGNAIDYLHRAGRTARAGAKGRVTSLLQSKRDRDMGKAIQYALEKGIGLDQISASGAEAMKPPQQQQPQQQGERWEPPKRERRVKGPTPIKGQKQVVQWNPDHKFIHISAKDGKPHTPFKELLKGKVGDERRRLLYEIAMDQKEWRRWRHAKAVEKADKRRVKRRAEEEAGLRERMPKPSSAQEKWQQKVAKKRQKQWAEKQEVQGQGRGQARDQPHWAGRGKVSGRKPLFGKK